MHHPNPENAVKPETNCVSASIDQCNDSKCIGYKIITGFAYPSFFLHKQRKTTGASGELELCSLCTWAVTSSSTESLLPAWRGGEERSGPFLCGCVAQGPWFTLQIYYFNPFIWWYRQHSFNQLLDYWPFSFLENSTVLGVLTPAF